MRSDKLQILAVSLILLMGFSVVVQAKQPAKYMSVFPFGADDFIMYAMTFMPSLDLTIKNLVITGVLYANETHFTNTTVIDINVTSNITVLDTVTAKYFNGSFNWTSGDTWNIFNGSILTWNESKLVGNVWFFESNNTVYGTVEGTLDLTAQYDDYDENSYNITDVVPNGMEWYANTSANVSTDINKICIRYRADGDDYDVSIYDTNDNDWENYLELDESISFIWACADIRDADEHIVDNKVYLKINDVGAANLQHKLYIDALYVSSGYTPRIGNEVDPLAIHISGDYDTSASTFLLPNSNWTIYNLTALVLSLAGIPITSWDEVNTTVAGVYVPYTGATQNVDLGGYNSSSNHTLIGNEEGDHAIYFYESGSPVGRQIRWDDSSDYFYFDDTIQVSGGIAGGTFAASGTMYSASDIYTTGVGDDLWLGSITQGLANFKAFANGSLHLLDLFATHSIISDNITLENITLNGNEISDWSEVNGTAGGASENNSIHWNASLVTADNVRVGTGPLVSGIGQLFLSSGSKTLPSIAAIDDPDTGIFLSAALPSKDVRISVANTQVAAFTSNALITPYTGSKTNTAIKMASDTDTGLFGSGSNFAIAVKGEEIFMNDANSWNWFNRGAKDIDFKVSTDTEATMLHIDGADNDMDIAGGYGSTGVTIYDDGNISMNGALIIDGTCTSEGADCNADIAELTHSKSSYGNTSCQSIPSYNKIETYHYYNITQKMCEYQLIGQYYEYICNNVTEKIEIVNINNTKGLCRDEYELVGDNKYNKLIICRNETPIYQINKTITIPASVSCSLSPSFFKEFESGDVVCIDDTDPQHIKFCDSSYDTKVISVVNYQATQIIGQRAPYPVSLGGNIPIKVVCGTPIEIGDLLVSSSVEGYAQSYKTWIPSNPPTNTELRKVWEHQGSVFAKALESCDSGTKIIRAWLT